MTASSDDAAASSVPPRAVGGPAAPSFLGTPGRRPPEDSPMPQHPTLSGATVAHEPLPDETVRMRTDGPAPDGGPRVADAADDTRPVTRDWLLGAPDPDAAPAAPAAAPEPVPADSDDWNTESFDRSPADDSTVAVAPQDDDETATLGAVPSEDDGDGGTGTPGGP